MDNKLIIIVLLLLLLGGGFYLVSSNRSQTQDEGMESTSLDSLDVGSDVGMEADVEEEVGDSMMEDEESMTEDEGMMEDEAMMEDEMEEEGMMEESEVKVFEVGGGAYYFDPDEITVTEGDTVRIVFTNEGGTHDWVLDEFNASVAVTQTGETAEVEFVADTAGTYEYYCSVGNHRELGMVGTLIVEPKQ